MTESYAFFGGTPEDPRQYNQIEFAEVLERFFRNGYFPGVGTEVAVFPTDPARLAVRVGTGQAWINGYWYKNDTWKEIDLAPADDTNDRIDRIVLRLDTVNARNIEAVVKTGTPAANPTAPDLERTEQIYELSLATVRVNSGATSITASNITDTRDDEILCGRAVPWNVPTDEDLYQHVSDNVRHITASERSSWNAKETPAGAQAKADAAEQAAIEWVRERGIGSPGQTIDDLNNATEPGRWYVAGSSTANAPDGLSWWTVLVAYRNSSNLAQIAFRTIGGATQTKIRFLSGGTWTSWENIWTSFNLPNPAQTDVDNNFTRRQTVKNGSNYEYVGVRRDVSGTEYGAEVAVSASGYAQLVKRDEGNIVESIDIRGVGDARVGNNRIWHEGNLSSPARTNVENHFTSAQRIQNLLRLAATSESGIIQAGENSNDTNARLRITRSNTTSSPIALMEIFSQEVKINGNDVWHTGNQGNPNNLNTSSKQIVGAINELFTTVSNGKQAIRDAIADAGGTPPSGSPDQYTHQDLANAISTVSKYASGEEPTSSTTSMTVQVRGIDFSEGAFYFFYQTNDDGAVSGMFRLDQPYSAFIRQSNTVASAPTITPVTGGFDITISRPADTGFSWEAWGK